MLYALHTFKGGKERGMKGLTKTQQKELTQIVFEAKETTVRKHLKDDISKIQISEKLETILLPQINGTTLKTLGKRVTFPGYEQFEFYVHPRNGRPVNQYDVSEKSSGGRIKLRTGAEDNTEKIVVEQVFMVIKSKPMQDILEAIEAVNEKRKALQRARYDM